MGFIRDIFRSPSMPAPVNYQQVGQDQAAANRDAALLSAQIARPDVISPYQTSRYLDIGGPDEDRWAISQTLAPEYEQMRQREAGIQGGIQSLAAQRLGQIEPQAFTAEGLPAEPGAFNYQQEVGLSFPQQGQRTSFQNLVDCREWLTKQRISSTSLH